MILAPKAPPANITYELQTPDRVVLRWDPPAKQYRNGIIVGYLIQFHKSIDELSRRDRNISLTRTVFGGLEKNTVYVYRIKAFTEKGGGPFSDRMTVQTPPTFPISPANVNAMATSDTTIEVWWDAVNYTNGIMGYKVRFLHFVFRIDSYWLDAYQSLPLGILCQNSRSGSREMGNQGSGSHHVCGNR